MVEVEPSEVLNADPRKRGVSRIEQHVVLSWNRDGGHHQDQLRLGYKPIASVADATGADRVRIPIGRESVGASDSPGCPGCVRNVNLDVIPVARRRMRGTCMYQHF